MKLDRIVLSSQFDPRRIVTSHEIFSKKSFSLMDDGSPVEQKRFAEDSLFSRKIFGDLDSKEEYSCECGHLHGKFYDGTVCQKCKTPVEFIGLNINRYGWIDLSLSKYDENGVVIEKGNGCHLIEYIPYYQLEKVLGRDNLKNVIHTHNVINIAGDIDVEELELLRSEKPETKYWYLGLDEFYEKYNEVLDYYYNLRGNRYTEMYEFLKNREEVFTDKIPVISVILRPAIRTADGLKLDDINIKYQSILKNLEMLKDVDSIKLIRDSTIEQMQAEFMLLSEEIIDAIKSKSGLIRNQICGTRINFSARNIISPARSGIKMDELVVPYATFLELYKFEIISILKEIEGISIKEAEREWFNATLKYDEKIWKIMQKMVSDNEVGVLLNRNPTIAYGSILYLKIAAVKKDFDDVTLSLHDSILTLFRFGVYTKYPVIRRITRTMIKFGFDNFRIVV